jgi:transposase
MDEDYTVFTQKYNEKINCWGAFSARGKIDLVFFTQNLNSDRYVDIIEENIEEMKDQSKHKKVIILMDNDPKHTSAKAYKCYKRHEVTLLDWPSYSPDLNPIENIWGKIKRKLSMKKCSNVRQLKELISKYWNQLTINDLKIYAKSMEHRIERCIKNKGGIIDY